MCDALDRSLQPGLTAARGVTGEAIMGPNAGMWQNLITFVIVLLLILIFPNGILGKKYIKKV